MPCNTLHFAANLLVRHAASVDPADGHHLALAVAHIRKYSDTAAEATLKADAEAAAATEAANAKAKAEAEAAAAKEAADAKAKADIKRHADEMAALQAQKNALAQKLKEGLEAEKKALEQKLKEIREQKAQMRADEL